MGKAADTAAATIEEILSRVKRDGDREPEEAERLPDAFERDFRLDAGRGLIGGVGGIGSKTTRSSEPSGNVNTAVLASPFGSEFWSVGAESNIATINKEKYDLKMSPGTRSGRKEESQANANG